MDPGYVTLLLASFSVAFVAGSLSWYPYLVAMWFLAGSRRNGLFSTPCEVPDCPHPKHHAGQAGQPGHHHSSSPLVWRFMLLGVVTMFVVGYLAMYFLGVPPQLGVFVLGYVVGTVWGMI